MTTKQKSIYVYDDFSFYQPMLIGMLYVNTLKGAETYSFEYNEQWLKKTNLMVSLDPELSPYAGRQYPIGKTIFGLFADASPDRWGRVLMNKRERILAERESRKPVKLYDSDYLLGVYDETRMGGIRLKQLPDGDMLSLNVDDEDNSIDITLAVRTAERFGIKNTDADEMAKEIQKIVRENWTSLALKYGLSRRQIEEMKPAFSACF